MQSVKANKFTEMTAGDDGENWVAIGPSHME